MIPFIPDRVWTSDQFLWTRMVYAHHVEAIRAKTNRSQKKLETKNGKTGHPKITDITDLIGVDP